MSLFSDSRWFSALPLQRHRVAQHLVRASLGGELNLCVPEFNVVVAYLGERLIAEPLQCPGRVRESLEKIVVGLLRDLGHAKSALERCPPRQVLKSKSDSRRDVR